MSERPLELCFICDEPTGRAGKGEDSLYCDECDKGPCCPDCFRKHHESDMRVAQLEEENKSLREAIQQAVDKIYDEDDPDAAKPWLMENVLGLLAEALAADALLTGGDDETE